MTTVLRKPFAENAETNAEMANYAGFQSGKNAYTTALRGQNDNTDYTGNMGNIDSPNLPNSPIISPKVNG